MCIVARFQYVQCCTGLRRLIIRCARSMQITPAICGWWSPHCFSSQDQHLNYVSNYIYTWACFDRTFLTKITHIMVWYDEVKQHDESGRNSIEKEENSLGMVICRLVETYRFKTQCLATMTSSVLVIVHTIIITYLQIKIRNRDSCQAL